MLRVDSAKFPTLGVSREYLLSTRLNELIKQHGPQSLIEQRALWDGMPCKVLLQGMVNEFGRDNSIPCIFCEEGQELMMVAEDGASLVGPVNLGAVICMKVGVRRANANNPAPITLLPRDLSLLRKVPDSMFELWHQVIGRKIWVDQSHGICRIENIVLGPDGEAMLQLHGYPTICKIQQSDQARFELCPIPLTHSAPQQANA